MATEFQPYVGPRPFELKDKEIFFGREREARDLLSLVIAHNVVLVYAQSGAGKTSLLNARLIPMLKENGFEVFPVARMKGIPSGKIKNEDVPNIFVFNTLMSWVEGEKSIDIENISRMTIVNFLNERKHPIDEYDQELPRAIIFDQFEEMFSLLERWKDIEGFFAQVSEALRDPLLRVVFVIREDYIAQLDPYANLLPEKLRTRFRLERLNKEAALLAVKEPLKNTGRFFAEGVAEKLVDEMLKIRIETNPGETNELAGEFVEAVQLQVICQNLWLGLPENVMEINMDHLETFGDVEKALSLFYDEALREAATNFPIDEERLRQWCEEMLITSMGTRSTVYRAPESTGGIPNEVIDFLEGKHLIRAEIRAGARWYELTHDRFIEPILSSNKYYRSKDTDSRKKKEVSRRANQAIKKAEQAWGDKNYEEALKWFEEALANYEGINDSKGRVNTYLNIGNIYYELGNYDLTIEKCQKALEINPISVYAYSKWGSALYNLERYEEASEKFQKAIEIDPISIYIYNNWGSALYKLMRYEEAIEKFQKAIEIDPKSAFAYSNWGSALYKLGRYEEASEKCKKAIEINPKSAFAYSNWGSALSELGRYEEASEKCKKAIEIDPKYVYAYDIWGSVFYDTERYEEAIEKCQKAIEIDPKYVNAYNNWGSVLSKLERYEEASEKFQKAIEIDPKSASVYSNWGLVLSKLERYEEAIEKCKKAIEIDPKYANAYDRWGLILSKLERYEEASEKFQKAIEIDPNYASSWYNKACLLTLASGDSLEISKYLGKAIELDPKYIQNAEKDLDFKRVKNRKWFKNILLHKEDV